MKIKRLEIKGFKSFPDKTVFEFKPGITGIVGPNGCGKSNVMEAIRWVMGEQRTRSLRAKKMDDIIFNGSENRKPVGMAEVRLILANDGGSSHPSMADYDEIMIARRLFRDGESQYELNNIPCRLSDITDFFLDTGVGKNSYAIIEQGRVDMVVASKPEDRRVLIEEAAGINRYKSRREAALKKLEQTQHNLERISDVIREVKRQHSSLKRQASKAERYRRLSERLRNLDLATQSYRCTQLQHSHRVASDQLELQKRSLIERESLFASLEARLEADRVAALDAEKTLKEVMEALHRTDIELTSARGKIERHAAQIAQAREGRERGLREQEAAGRRSREASHRKQELEQSKSELDSELKSAAATLQEALTGTKAKERELDACRKRVETLKEAAFQNLQRTAQENNRRERLTRRGTEIDATANKIAKEIEEISAGLFSDVARHDTLLGEATETAKQRDLAEHENEVLALALSEAKTRIGGLRKEISELDNRLARDSARVESLEELRREYHGYDRGVRFLMKNRDSLIPEALLGPLAELIEVPADYQKAATAILGARLGHLVVSSPRDAILALDRLKESGEGRSTLIPLRPRPGAQDGNGEVPEGATSLKSVVRFRDGCDSLWEFLLGRCFVVDNLRDAVEIWEKNGIVADLVTRDGEVVTRHGEITGGCHDESHEELFEKRREIEELRGRMETIRAAIAEKSAALVSEESRAADLGSRIDEQKRVTQDLTVQEVRIKKDVERFAAQIATARRKTEVLELEKQRLASEKDGLAAELEAVGESLENLARKQKDLENEKQDASRKVEELAASVNTESERTSELRVRTAQLEERKRSLDREYQSAVELTAQLEKRLALVREDLERSAAEGKRLSEELEATREREKELMREREAHGVDAEKLKRSCETLTVQVKSLEQESGAARKEIMSLREAVHTLEMETARLEQSLEGIVEKVVERYAVDPRTLSSPESLPSEEEIEGLRSQIEALGEVNLAAIAECAQAEERLTFLVEQESDLKSAVESLYATINKINRTTRERFREAFDSINTKFQEIFPYLFRGGEARLQLTDENDLLETGVEIVARPPGKRKQNMDLLSGGEKALTAVALIFSIFLIRPSPFCLLDEVDAPLDDANLVRFNEMLRDISDRTQFLVITHNKRSMEEADSLYGVTMEEPGVSAVVSVRFMD
jgi:chromosome segregation protein